MPRSASNARELVKGEPRLGGARAATGTVTHCSQGVYQPRYASRAEEWPVLEGRAAVAASSRSSGSPEQLAFTASGRVNVQQEAFLAEIERRRADSVAMWADWAAMWCAPEEERASSLYSILELPSISVSVGAGTGAAWRLVWAQLEADSEGAAFPTPPPRRRLD